MRFLEKVAIALLETGDKLKETTVVLPSERAIKYLKAELYEANGGPLLSPKMITIDRLVKSNVELTVIDRTRAMIKLFEIHQKHLQPDEEGTFEEFMSWSTMLLSDFDEIDRQLLSADQVFKNLADIKELETWELGESELTPAQKRFLAFWDRLGTYYYELNDLLEKDGCCYAGKAFKLLEGDLESLFKDQELRQFAFVGFNALSKAEISIIRQLDNMGRAQIFVDADVFYANDKDHEAGYFIRKLQSELKIAPPSFIEDNLIRKQLNIKVISCAQNTGQVKVASTILGKMTKQEVSETMLLLADETLISSMINNIPKNVGKANITLGLPIRNTSVKTWVDLLFSIQENKGRFSTESIYYRDLQAFFRHPFLLSILSDNELKLINGIERSIVTKNRIFLSPTKLDLTDFLLELIEAVFGRWKDWFHAIDRFRNLNRLVYRKLEKEHAFEKALLESYDRSLLDLEGIMQDGFPLMKLGSFKQLFNAHWSRQTIAYHGNPIDGLQIMGLLETRAIDFKRIIVVGMNEGSLPPTNPIQTIIPMDLRRYLGLPTPRDKQGLFAHHFYRLLHRCEDLIITHSTAEDKMGGAEPSRYLAQLELELAREAKGIGVENFVYSLEDTDGFLQQDFHKTDDVIQRMDELFERSTSASMLRKYMDCPLDFYFRYVTDFGDSDGVEEEIENSTFGTFIHETLEELYKPFARFNKQGEKVDPQPKNITSFDVEEMLKVYKLELEQKFLAHFNNDREAFEKGKNRLSYEMANELTRKFLESERDFLSCQSEPVFIESLESEYSHDLTITVRGEKKKIHLRGFIDRIDSVGGKYRVIDYKSGKIKQENVSISSRDKTTEDIVKSICNSNRKYVLQLMIYNYLFYKKHGELGKAGIISLISGNGKIFELNTAKFSMQDIVENFEKYLTTILEDIYDKTTPFVHTASEYTSYCKYCE